MLQKVRHLLIFEPFCLPFSFLSLSAQQGITISGTILDARTNDPVVGATILEKGTRNGATTDAAGVFKVVLQNQEAVLVISYLGYLSQEVAAKNGMEVLLTEDAVGLDQVTVTALGIERRKKRLAMLYRR